MPVREAAILRAEKEAKDAYGSDCPLKYQMIIAAPAAISYEIDSENRLFQEAVLGDRAKSIDSPARRARAVLRDSSEVMVGGDWDLFTKKFSDNQTRKRIFRKLEGGLTWSDVGAYQWLERAVDRFGVFDGCSSAQDIRCRFKVLDDIIRDCRLGIGLKPRRLIEPNAFREYGGIAVVIGRDGEILSASAGNHRLAIAQYFGLEAMPLCLCAVHPLAMVSGVWKNVKMETEKWRSENAFDG